MITEPKVHLQISDIFGNALTEDRSDRESGKSNPYHTNWMNYNFRYFAAIHDTIVWSDQNLFGLFKRSSHISPTKLLFHSVTSNEHIFSHSHFQRILPSSVTSLNNSRGHKIHLAKKSSNRTTSHSLPVQFEFNSLFLTDIFHKVLNPFAVNRYLLFWSLPVNSPYGVRRKEYILA